MGRTFSLYFPGSGYPISIPFSTFFVLFVIHRDSAFSPLFILNLFFDLCENGVDGCTKQELDSVHEDSVSYCRRREIAILGYM